MITLDEAKALKSGDILIDEQGKRWKVNGQVKTWKTDPSRIRVPLKHGLFVYDALNTQDFIDGKCEALRMEP
jgi:hypothetical protein